MAMDNHEFLVRAEGDRALRASLDILLETSPGRQVTHTSVVPPGIPREPYESECSQHFSGERAETLVLFWSKPSHWEYPLQFRGWSNPETMFESIKEWLEKHPLDKRDMGGEEWSEIWRGKGFLAYQDFWGRIGPCHYAFGAFRPICTWVGK